MEIKKLRKYIGMSQREFSSYFGIPTGTLRNWEQSIASPPSYVLNMIITALRRDKMINVETIKFLKMLDELVELVENGIEEFGKANEATFGTKIFYDKRTKDSNGNYSIVRDADVLDDEDYYHHDVVSYFGCDTNEYKVQVAFDEDFNTPYVLVTLIESGEQIVVEDQHWYFV